MKHNFLALNKIREAYPPGTRVELISTTDPYTKLKPKDKGVVSKVDDIGTVHINWDNGSTLGMVLSEDVIRKVGD